MIKIWRENAVYRRRKTPGGAEHQKWPCQSAIPRSMKYLYACSVYIYIYQCVTYVNSSYLYIYMQMCAI